MGNSESKEIDHTVTPNGQQAAKTEIKNRFKYKHAKRETVEIKERMNPFKELSIPQNASPGQTKAALKKNLSSHSRQQRAMASLAYYMITSQARVCFKKIGDEFVITNEDIFLLTAIGHTKKVEEMITNDSTLIHARDEFDHIPLYLAARGGFYDLTKLLVDADRSMVNHQQMNGSTALHAAAFFGRTEIMKLLLELGASSNVKNQWGHTAEDEIANESMKKIFSEYNTDSIAKIQEELQEEDIQCRERPIFYGTNQDVLGIEVILMRNEDIPNDWVTAWHGTRLKSLVSIAKYGLRPSGSTLPDGTAIKPLPGHIPQNYKFLGQQKWANAIFLSPSFHYAAHTAYAERIFSEKERYSVLVKVAFNPSVEYGTFQPTTFTKHESLHGEPVNTEYRIDSEADDVIFRIESDEADIPPDSDKSTSNMIIRSFLFIKVGFLENLNSGLAHHITYHEMVDLLS